MGSTTPPENQHDQRRQQPSQQNDPGTVSRLTNHQLRELLERRDLEIRQLKLELEKYKLALESLKLNQQSENIDRFASASETVDDTLDSLLGTTTASVGSPMPVAAPPALTETCLSKEISSQIENPSTSGEVILKTVADDDENEEVSLVARKNLLKPCDTEPTVNIGNDEITADMQGMIQDVGDIDLDLELNKNHKKRRKPKKDSAGTAVYEKDEFVCDTNDGKTKHDNECEKCNDEDEVDIITDGLLTSLTDAAINNLSQLAALQERCESQKQHSQQTKSISHEQYHTTPKQDQPLSGASIFPCNSSTPILTAPSTTVSTSAVSTPASKRTRADQTDDRAGFDIQDPFLMPDVADPAALALSSGVGSSSILGQAINVSSTSGQIQTSTSIQAQQDLSQDQSLASVVAAAAAAAAEAAAVDEHQRQHIPPNQQIQHSQQQSRLISSAMASSDIYQHLHQRQLNLAHQISPISSLHFSPSITSPSPSSLIGGPANQARRSGSNASSSLLSPIASPNYLRRQYLPEACGISMLSPSPTTSLATVGSSSGLGSGSSSAHMFQMAHHNQPLHHHHSHPQQRSVSALAGPISSPSSSNAPLGGTASTAVSPLMTSKNSSQARLNNMQIRHKFGYLGSGRGQFNSPHGFCLGLNQEIVVADTNNHRVCIFDKDGTYITQFGSPGKEEGQLWNPRKVAILQRPTNGNGTSSASCSSSSSLMHSRSGPSLATTFSTNFTSGGGIQGAGAVASGSRFANEPLYVVCDRGAERSRMQLFTKDGAFIKKIGIHYIDIVAGLAITQNGLIIVVDSVSPTVYIINADTGTLNGWFDCSGHMKEPSDIAVKSDIPGNEYFICDFKGHCVVVFSEQGDYLRKIGHDGLTSYPNGIDISDDGDILVGDSHGNRFHVVVFDRNGNFVSQFECPHVKVSRCCGLKITREGYIVTLAKNNHHVLVLDTIHI